jgi:hypothetical protein
MRPFLLFYFILAFVTLGCERKEFPVPELEEPEFFISGQIDNQSVSWNAGDDGFYATSDVEYTADGSYTYSSQLVRLDCSECPGQLEVAIHSQSAYLPWQDPVLDNDIFASNYPYAMQTADVNYNQIQFIAPFDGLGSYVWVLPAETTSIVNPYMALNGTGPMEVGVNYNISGLCQTLMTQTVGLGNNEVYCLPVNIIVLSSFQIMVTDLFQDLPHDLELTHLSLDGNYIEIIADTMIINITELVPHLISAHFVNANGHFGSYSVQTIFGLEGCIEPFTWVYNSSNATEFGSVSISYWHPNGSKYISSLGTNQSTASYFQVQSVDDYESASGANLKKASLAFDCQLINEADATDTIHFDHMVGEFLFGSDE